MNLPNTESDGNWEPPPFHRNLDHERYEQIAFDISRFTIVYLYFTLNFVLLALALGWLRPEFIGLTP
ncbi:MAG TPA: hypothetical protein VN841_13110 [Bryobacteraceae bacterium]|nr:hypothetical protein [Bryobacteraceae bacterium]